MAVSPLKVPEKDGFERREPRNALHRATRDSEKQHSALMQHWLKLGEYLKPENVRARSEKLASRAKKSKIRATLLRAHAIRLIQRSRALRRGLPRQRANADST